MASGIEIKGLKKLDKKLKKLGGKTANRVIKKGVTKGAKPLLSAARSYAPRDTGRLRKAIKSRVIKNNKKDEAGRNVFIDPGSSRSDESGAWYGYILNSGYIARDGSYVPGLHFMEKAYDSKKSQATNATIREIENGIMSEAN